MEPVTYVFLKLRKKPARDDIPDSFEVVKTASDLLILSWRASLSDLTEVEESSERLWVELGSAILEHHSGGVPTFDQNLGYRR